MEIIGDLLLYFSGAKPLVKSDIKVISKQNPDE